MKAYYAIITAIRIVVKWMDSELIDEALVYQLACLLGYDPDGKVTFAKMASIAAVAVAIVRAKTLALTSQPPAIEDDSSRGEGDGRLALLKQCFSCGYHSLFIYLSKSSNVTANS
jgi:hypothetical protein